MKTVLNRPSVEPLESRIAPARIIQVGLNLPDTLNQNTSYNEAPFINTEGATDPISLAVGGGIAGVADTFYLRLFQGDMLKLLTTSGGSVFEEFLTVKSGQMVVFFTDQNLDNEVQALEFSGISLGKNASFSMKGALPGDIVANLDDNGTPRILTDDFIVMGTPGQSVKADYGIKAVDLGDSVGSTVGEGLIFEAATVVAEGPGVLEKQAFDLINGQAKIGDSFRLSFGDFTTASLLSSAAPADVQSALNALQNISAVGGVTVENAEAAPGVPIPGSFIVTFNLAGDRPEVLQVRADSNLQVVGVESVSGSPVTQEVQSLDLSLVDGLVGRMSLTFHGISTDAISLGASATLVQGVLNSMPDIIAAGGVTVAGGAGTPFVITFNELGDQTGVIGVDAFDFSEKVVGGSILASGNISKVFLASGGVQQILAGGAANGATFDFFPTYLDKQGRIVDTPGGDGVFNFTPADGKVGANISNVTISRLGIEDRTGGVGLIHAGEGGLGGKGGSLNQIVIRGDADGFTLAAGDGGDSGGAKKNGGAGGTLSKVFVDGIDDGGANDMISLFAGNGGSAVGTTGTGGLGGKVSEIYLGYTLVGAKPIQAAAPLRDDIIVLAGDGGDGRIGGKGAPLSNLNIITSTPDGLGDEITVRSGAGGGGLTGGSGGTGGALSNTSIQNVDLSVFNQTVISAGDGGSGVDIKGAAGGTVSGLTLIGRQFDISAGRGSDGKTGGAGGSLKTVNFQQINGVIPDEIFLNAGRGGDGTAGAGGRGGDVVGVTSLASDLLDFGVNSTAGAGDGGFGLGGKGGLGGKVSTVRIGDLDLGLTNNHQNLFSVRSGNGGGGDKGGGNGGAIDTVSFLGSNIEIAINSGDGGSATSSGVGGNAGNITRGEFSAGDTVLKVVAGVPTRTPVDTMVQAGVGGDGAGTRGRGGLGGNISQVNLNTQGSGFVAAGTGGDGSGAAPGKGGSINIVGLYATAGDATMLAGDGGLNGVGAAAGGNIVGTSVDKLTSAFSADDILVQAGDGSHGGAGGSIRYVGYGSSSLVLVPTPTGDISIIAGDGSAEGKLAGAGGSILEVNGSVGSTSGTTTKIQAGSVVGTGSKSAAGGSITSLALQRSGDAAVEITIDAGDANDTTGATGAKGGSVSNVTVIDVEAAAILRHIAAGDGGAGAKTGGAGGSVTRVDVRDHDIGLRTGALFGYNGLGGIFAGAGGAGATKTGLSGNVSIITADAIGSIVAGKAAVPKLVNKVDNIFLNDTNLLQQSRDSFLPGIPLSNIVYIFENERTAPLPKNASPEQVAEALNMLGSITAAGGVVGSSILPNGYRIIFKNKNDQSQITAEEVIDYTAVETRQGLNDQPLPVTELVQGDTLLAIKEVQTVRIDPALQGRLSIVFGANATAFTSATRVTAAALQGRLNLMPSVVAAGGVTVVSQGNNVFQITFGHPGDQPSFSFQGDDLPLGYAAELQEGDPGVQETQQFSILPGTDNSFQVTYGTARTGFLSVGQTVSVIEQQINALPTIVAAGGVTVTEVREGSPLVTTGYTVTFKTAGDRDPLLVLNRTLIGGQQQTLGVATTLTAGSVAGNIAEVQRVTAPLSGRFAITFGVDSTPTFAFNADPLEVETALNNILAIQNLGGVAVNATPDGTAYDITFGLAGAQQQFTASGIQIDQPVTEATKGVNHPNALEVQRIQYDPNGKFTVTFPNELSANETFKGSPAQSEKQILDLTAIRALAAGSEFELTYDPTGDGVDTLTEASAPIPYNADLITIQAAIDSIQSITAAGGAVASLTGDVLTITFNALADQGAVVTGQVLSGFQETTPINGGDSPETIRASLEAQLNLLPAIISSGGVDVAIGDGNSLNVIFHTPGNKPGFHATNDVNEIQTAKFYSLGEYQFTYEGEQTPRLAANPDPVAAAAAVQSALNALGSITTAGGVTVTNGINNDFTITFNVPANATDLTAQQFLPINSTTVQNGIPGAQQEIQTVTQPQRFIFDPAYFATANFVGGFTDSGELDAFKFRWVDTDLDGYLDINEAPLDGLIAAKSYNPFTTNFTPEARLFGPITGDYNFSTMTNGTGATAEVQSLIINADTFNLAFGNQVTKQLTGKSSAAAIAKALNALPSIIAAGGVAVAPGAAAHTFTVNFNSPGDQPQIYAPFFYDFNNIIL